MQDFQSIPGLADLIFGGGAANADSGGGKADLRRLRGYPGPGMAPAQQPPVKCPRCDSTNTKFCYYNNYNLSQPRYFCKSCRRYWTKGGVLRNVPVGGGCRKSKRSFSSSSSKSSIKSSANKDNHRRPSSASQSSSDSYGLNANTAAVADGTTSSTPFPNPATLPLTSQTSNSTPNPPVDPIAVVNTAPLYPTPDIFPEPASAGSFRGLMETAKTTPAILGFDFSNTSSLRIPAQRQSAPAAGEEVRGVVQQGFMDPTVAMDLRAPIRGGDESIGLAATATVDWSGSMDTRIFDFAGAVDPATVYWCQSHLADTDPSLYLA